MSRVAPHHAVPTAPRSPAAERHTGIESWEVPEVSVEDGGEALAESFLDFEHRDGRTGRFYSQYDDYFVRLTPQSIGALLDAARVCNSNGVLDVATGPGYVAGAAAARAATVAGVHRVPVLAVLAIATKPGRAFITSGWNGPAAPAAQPGVRRLKRCDAGYSGCDASHAPL